MLYILKNWFTILLIAPFLSDLINYNDPNIDTYLNFLAFFPYTFIFGFIFSLPTYIVYVLVFNYLEKKNVKLIYAKTILICLTIIGIYIPFYFVFNNREPNACLSYILTSIFFGYFYNIKTNNNDNN